MTDREKLIRLLITANNLSTLDREADFLLAHGVTIKEPGESSDDCFREKTEHQLKGIYEHLREVDLAIDTLRAQTLPLRENVIPWFAEPKMHKNVGGTECQCGAPMKGESNV